MSLEAGGFDIHMHKGMHAVATNVGKTMELSGLELSIREMIARSTVTGLQTCGPNASIHDRYHTCIIIALITANHLGRMKCGRKPWNCDLSDMRKRLLSSSQII